MSFVDNPRHPNNPPKDPPREKPGPIAADSLAAESVRTGGAFSSNPDSQPLGVRGGNSTLANTDTAGAYVLHPSASGATRELEDSLGAGPNEKGPSGMKYPDAVGVSGDEAVGAGRSDFGASRLGAGTDADDSMIRSTGSEFRSSNGPNSGGGNNGVRPYVDPAPTYTHVATGSAYSDGTYKPKGVGLDDADQTDSMPKTKTFTGNVGGANDPGRLAEQNFAGRDAAGNAAVEGARKGLGVGNSASGTTGGGVYSVLESERA